MIVAINYADFKYRNAQKFNSVTAVYKGRVDKVISYSPSDMNDDFRKKNRDILSRKRGNGYWLWKPYFITRTLEELSDGDYLIYLDSGAFYINNVRHLIRQMEKDGQFIMAFELPVKECQYTKRDVFLCMDCDKPEYVKTKQRMATMIILKNVSCSRQFVWEWLEYCQKDSIITDAGNCLGKNNYLGFIENRHDQSIFSILSKKYGIKAYRDPSQYGRVPDLLKEMYSMTGGECVYPQIIAVHRSPRMTKRIFWEQIFFAYAPIEMIKIYLALGLQYKPDK